jgi:hypothetical protein
MDKPSIKDDFEIEIDTSSTQRISYVLRLAWNLLFEKIINKKVVINKEASLQLHLAKILQEIGNAFCVLPNENFEIEMESNIDGANIDITCILGESKAAIELKLFKKSSNRPGDFERYDCFKDIMRLEKLQDFEIQTFICLTDHPYYAKSIHKGKAKMFTTTNGTKYSKGVELIPGWQNQWKNKSRDQSITLQEDLQCNWIKKNGWYYWYLNR